MIIISVLFFLYISTILVFTIKFDKVVDFILENKEPKTAFTIVVPFRNEVKNLPLLLASIEDLNYPTALFQIIFIDDASSDNSIEAITKLVNKNQYQIRILPNDRASNSPKKDAITTALKSANTEWIITTDADCELPKNWLKTFDNYIQQHNCNMVVAPVTYSANNSFLHQFQLLDFLSLQASTISGFGLQKPFLCNGANLAYKKSVFKKVNGFENNNSIASGDDIFLFEKFLQFESKQVHYLKSKEVIVTTFPVSSWSHLLQQRVRWASKTTNYTLGFGKLIGAIVFIGNLIVAAIPLLVLTSSFSIYAAISIFLTKLLFDYLLINKVCLFYKQKIRFSTYLKSGFLYPYFTILVFLKSITSTYQWKGRTFKK